MNRMARPGRSLPVWLLLFAPNLFFQPSHGTELDTTNRTRSYQLNGVFYGRSCPDLFSIVRSGVERAIQTQPRNAASFIRLFFHDCFVHGCDASILLDDTVFSQGEKSASANKNSVRGYEFIDVIKSEIERACPRTVSCADILAVVARDAVVLSGGPYFEVLLGRRDSLLAFKDLAERALPVPDNDLPQLLASFQEVGLAAEDLVALVGSHTIGFSRCANVVKRIYNDSGDLKPEGNIRPAYLKILLDRCPKDGDPDTLVPLDWRSPSTFDNSYYNNLMAETGLLHSDETLWSSKYAGPIRAIVQRFAIDGASFFESFARSMQRMGSIKPLLGEEGEIRENCRIVNS